MWVSERLSPPGRRRFFQKACEIAEVTPQRILVVGDDPTNDYEGAVTAGLSAVLYDPRGDQPNGIRGLRELLTFVPPVPRPG